MGAQKLDLSVIILTYNEEIHIRRCLDRICDCAKDVFVIDCYSNDKTLEIAAEYPEVTILQNKWVNYATQMNWAIENAPIKTKWVLRLDADEYLSGELKAELYERLPHLDDKYTGIVLPLQRVFLGKPINHGIAKGIKLLRLFCYGKARCESRQMDEHIFLLEGESIEFNGSFSDDNLNDISWWTRKHIGYASREAADLLNIEYDIWGDTTEDENLRLSGQALEKRKKKLAYARKPLFLRSFMYFIYRYIFRGGFLDGKEGFLWDFLQGWWYRALVDAKIYEAKKACGDDRERLRAYIKEHFGIAT